jgi:hypothetical protein
MIIYNVTSNVQESIRQWMIWMQHKHIPEILATGKFISARLVRVFNRRKNWSNLLSAIYTDSKETLRKILSRRCPGFRAEIEKLLEIKFGF